MDTRTGKVIPIAEFLGLPPSERSHYINVTRDLTKLEEAQMQIRKNSPCGCGSGKKFKFCCYKKELKP